MLGGQAGQLVADGGVRDDLHDYEVALSEFAGCYRLQPTSRLVLQAWPAAPGQPGEDTVQPGAGLLPGQVAG